MNNYISSDTLKDYAELLNAKGSAEDKRAIEESQGYIRLDNLPDSIFTVFKHSPCVFVFNPDPTDKDGIGHWTLFSCIEGGVPGVRKQVYEYFDPLRYYNGGDIPEEIYQLFKRSLPPEDYDVEIELVPISFPLQDITATNCGCWVSLRLLMFHLDIKSWYNFIINVTQGAKITPDLFCNTIICPVVGEDPE